jgi:hypothetical protein
VYQNPCATDVFGDCRPIHSIREVGTEQPSFITAVWDYKELKIKSVNGTLSLNDIEVLYYFYLMTINRMIALEGRHTHGSRMQEFMPQLYALV